MNKISIITSVVNGRVADKKAVENALTLFNDKDIEIQIKEIRKKRSNPQNRYYWGVVIPYIQGLLMQEWGENFDSESIHEFLKSRFNSQDYVNEKTGEVITISKSTAENNTKEMEDYLEKCRVFAFDFFNARIPLPNE